MKQINTRVLFFNNADGKKDCNELTIYNSISVINNKDELTDTCSIKVPKDGLLFLDNTLNFKTKDKDLDIYSPGCVIGDIVRIYASLDNEQFIEAGEKVKDKTNLLFYGFVSEIKLISDNEYEIKCEDSMWLFKQKTKKLNLNNTKLKDFLSDLLGYYDIPESGGASKLLGQSSVPMFNIIPCVYEDINTFGKYISNRPEFGTVILDKLQDQTSNLVSFKFINCEETTGKSNVGYLPTLFAGRFEKYPQSELTKLNVLKSDLNHFNIKVTKNTYKYTDDFDEIRIKNGEKYMPIIDLDLEYVTTNKQQDLIYVVVSKQTTGGIIKYATYFDGSVLKTDVVTKDSQLDALYASKKLSIKVTIPELSRELVKEYSIQGYKNYEDSGLRGIITVLGNSKVNLLDSIKLKLKGDQFSKNNQYVIETYSIDMIESSVTENEGYITKITLGGKI